MNYSCIIQKTGLLFLQIQKCASVSFMEAARMYETEAHFYFSGRSAYVLRNELCNGSLQRTEFFKGCTESVYLAAGTQCRDQKDRKEGRCPAF